MANTNANNKKKFLIRKQYILEGGIKMSGESVIIPFDNIEIEMPTGSNENSHATIATEEMVDLKIKSSIADAHKTIAGEIKVDTEAEALALIATYNAGGDLNLTNGRIFNNGNSTPGEVIFIVPNVGSSFKAEEIVIGAAKEMIMLSDENVIGARLTTLEGETKANAAAIAGKADASIADQVALNVTAIASNASDISTNENDIMSNSNDLGRLNIEVIGIKTKNEDQDGRLEALEMAEQLDDKVWEGSLTASASLNVSSIVDSNGDTFEFIAGKKLEFVFEHTSDAVEQGQDLVVDAANATPYSIGSIGFTAKISSAGVLTLVKPAGAGAIGDFKLIRVVEAKTQLASTVAYTKNDSDGKYATIVNLALANTAIAGKQDSVDQAIADTQTKSIVGAINNLIGKATQDEGLLANLGSLKTTDGDDLSTTTEELVTAKTLAATHYTSAEVDTAITTAITAALATVMRVTFDDASTGNYKIGKE